MFYSFGIFMSLICTKRSTESYVCILKQAYVSLYCINYAKHIFCIYMSAELHRDVSLGLGL